ncbi:MAG TPA: YigZ family protein [Candidatus Merdenecus merdavium]|nr:YigZ family protein [Candidatus Merdenecus merdavium]
MSKEYHVVYEGAEVEIVEKKSRFIATVKPIDSEEEALEFLQNIKKKYWNATHHCYAYVVGRDNEVMRCSDDGEPSGTAGKPMLDVLLKQNIHNTVVIVTRYFGGTLLGTGGLVRAYSKATTEGLASSTVILKQRATQLNVEADYNGIGKIQYVLGQLDIPIVRIDYTDTVNLTALVLTDLLEQVKSEITEATGGKSILKEDDDVDFAMIGKEPVIFPLEKNREE